MIARFNAVGLGGKKSFKCSCGKRVVRQKRFEQTLNPYNLTKDGRVKTQWEIMAECSAAFVAWQEIAEPCTHAAAMLAEKGKGDK